MPDMAEAWLKRGVLLRDADPDAAIRFLSIAILLNEAESAEAFLVRSVSLPPHLGFSLCLTQ